MVQGARLPVLEERWERLPSWRSGAGVGLGILRGRVVSWFLGFLFVWLFCFGFLGCLVLDFCFLGFKGSKIYQISISCLLMDIDLISKLFKNLLDRSS